MAAAWNDVPAAGGLSECAGLVRSAEALRTSAPELSVQLARRALLIGATDLSATTTNAGEARSLFMRAQAVLAGGLVRISQHVGAVEPGFEALALAESGGALVLSAEIRLDLAACAQDVGEPLLGGALLRPVLEAGQAPPSVRAAALGRLVGCVAHVARRDDIEDALTEADRLLAADDGLSPDARRIERARLAVRSAAYHRWYGDNEDAVTAARDGLTLLGRLRRELRSESDRLRARLVLELVCGLLDEGELREAEAAARSTVDEPVRATSAASVGQLMLAVATRVHLPSGEIDRGRRLLDQAAWTAERHGLDSLLADALTELSRLDEQAGRTTDALEAMRAARAAEQRRMRAVARAARHILVQVGTSQGARDVTQQAVAALLRQLAHPAGVPVSVAPSPPPVTRSPLPPPRTSPEPHTQPPPGELAGEIDTDKGTGLLNREGLFRRLRSVRKGERPVALTLVRLDANNNEPGTEDRGPDTGIMAGLADKVRDMAPENAELARPDGGELAVLLPHTTRDEAEEFAATIRETATKSDWLAGGSGKDISISTSVVQSNPTTQDDDTQMDAAGMLTAARDALTPATQPTAKPANFLTDTQAALDSLLSAEAEASNSKLAEPQAPAQLPSSALTDDPPTTPLNMATAGDSSTAGRSILNALSIPTGSGGRRRAGGEPPPGEKTPRPTDSPELPRRTRAERRAEESTWPTDPTPTPPSGWPAEPDISQPLRPTTQSDPFRTTAESQPPAAPSHTAEQAPPPAETFATAETFAPAEALPTAESHYPTGTSRTAGTSHPTGTSYTAETSSPTETSFTAGTSSTVGTSFAAGADSTAGTSLPAETSTTAETSATADASSASEASRTAEDFSTAGTSSTAGDFSTAGTFSTAGASSTMDASPAAGDFSTAGTSSSAGASSTEGSSWTASTPDETAPPPSAADFSQSATPPHLPELKNFGTPTSPSRPGQASSYEETRAELARMMSALNAKALRARSTTPDDTPAINDQPPANPVGRYDSADRLDIPALGQSIPTPPDPDEMPEPPAGPDIPEPPRRPDIPAPPDPNPVPPNPAPADPDTPPEPASQGGSTRSRLMAAFDALTGPMPPRTTFEDNTPNDRPSPPEAPADKPTIHARFESGTGLPSRKPRKSWSELESASTVDSPADNLFGTPTEKPKTPSKSSLGAAFAAFELADPPTTPDDAQTNAPEPSPPLSHWTNSAASSTTAGHSTEPSTSLPTHPAASTEEPPGDHSAEPSPPTNRWTGTTTPPATSSGHGPEPAEPLSLADRWAHMTALPATSSGHGAEPAESSPLADRWAHMTALPTPSSGHSGESAEPSPLADRWADTPTPPVASGGPGSESAESSIALPARWADSAGPSATSGGHAAESAESSNGLAAGWADSAGQSAVSGGGPAESSTRAARPADSAGQSGERPAEPSTRAGRGADSVGQSAISGEGLVEPLTRAGRWADSVGLSATSGGHGAEPVASSTTPSASRDDSVGQSATSGEGQAEPSTQAGNWADTAGLLAAFGGHSVESAASVAGRWVDSVDVSTSSGGRRAAEPSSPGGRSAEGAATRAGGSVDPGDGKQHGLGEPGARASAPPVSALDGWSAALPTSPGRPAAEPVGQSEPGPSAAQAEPSGASVAAVGSNNRTAEPPPAKTPTYDQPIGPERRPEGLPRRGERSATTIASLLTEALAAYQSTTDDEDEPHLAPERYDFLGDPNTIAGRHRSSE